MGLFRKFVSQTRKPEGFLGKMMLSGMNSGHAEMADWGFSHLPSFVPENAVDLGCGGGRNAGELLKKFPKAHVTAIDYSGLSVEKAKAYNQAAIAEGRCTVRQGDVSDLCLPSGAFDLATAFETVYFWPGWRSALHRWRRCSGRAAFSWSATNRMAWMPPVKSMKKSSTACAATQQKKSRQRSGLQVSRKSAAAIILRSRG